MPKNKIKKRPAGKNASRGRSKTAKIKTKKRVGILRTRKNKKNEENPEVIFDSKIGKTDALFISDPKDSLENNTPVQLPASEVKPELKIPEILPESSLDPAINEALKEFDALPEVQNLVKEKENAEIGFEEMPSKDNLENKHPEEDPKKSFWQKILFFKK